MLEYLIVDTHPGILNRISSLLCMAVALLSSHGTVSSASAHLWLNPILNPEKRSSYQGYRI